MLKEAFNSMLQMHSRDATLKRIQTPTDLTTAIKISPANFISNNEGPADVTIKGREFVIAKDFIVSPFDPIIVKGDKIVDPELGSMAIKEIKEMYDFGAKLMGWRVRCE